MIQELLMQAAINKQVEFRTGKYLTSTELLVAKELIKMGYAKCVALRIVIPKKGTMICED